MTNNLQLSAPFCGDDHDASALSVEVAQQHILAGITPLCSDQTERVPLLQALDRVLASDLIATLNVPPYANSAMDGYALHAGDLPQTATRQLRVVGDSFAGHPFTGVCHSGECVRIMTGAIMPSGLDTVIPQEHVEKHDDGTIRIDGRTQPGDNVRAAGEDLRQGQTMLARGRRITAADLGLIASQGFATVEVMRRLKVACFTTGDELVGVGEALQQGQIHDSNRYTLYAMLTHLHCEVTDFGVVPDNPDTLRAVMEKAASGYDMIISSGGVSVGAADYVRQIFNEIAQVDFWKVALKPGRPLIFGHLQNTVYFGLPGNPVAVMVTFSQFVHPALQKLAGEIMQPPLTLQAITHSTLKKRAGRTEYQRGILQSDTEGRLTVSKTGAQGSGILLSMSLANCFIILPQEMTKVEPGTVVTVQPFVGLF